jgi:rare lipoprotein A
VVQPVVSSQMVAVDATVAAPAPAALESGFYLQLGAYSRADNAETGARAWRHTRPGYPGRGTGGNLFRLYGGPFSSRADAARAAASLPESTGIKPIVIQR